jgi:hypothetical protein
MQKKLEEKYSYVIITICLVYRAPGCNQSSKTEQQDELHFHVLCSLELHWLLWVEV